MFLAGVLAVGVLAAFLFFSGQNERKVRAQKERELSQKLEELSQKDAEIASLAKQKKDLEEQFKSKTSEMEAAIKNYEEEATSLHADVDRLTQEKEALQGTNASYEKEISELKRQTENFESDRTNLLTAISDLKKDLAEAMGGRGKTQPAGLSRPDLKMNPLTGSVDLGKIVMRRSSGSAARVQSVDRLYHFIIVNAGRKDGLRKDMVLNVIREDRILAKVMVQKTAENAAAAVIVPEWTKEEIQVDDTVGYS